jgi:hypothetical protein
LLESARQLQDFCDRQGWRSCIIGGIAVLRCGQPPVTRDIHRNVLTGFGSGEERVIDAPLANYTPRLADARAFALRTRILLLSAPSGTGADVSLALAFEELVTARATAPAIASGMPLKESPSAIETGWIGSSSTSSFEAQLQPLADVKQDPEITQSLARLR